MQRILAPGLHALFCLASLVAAAALLPAQDAAAPASDRMHTNRSGAQLLRLPKEDDAFGFVVFGDRTGGPPEGIEVLKQAVHDTNLLDPDLVMTVGDLVNGYNAAAAWQAQAAEYKAAMGKLRMPWFPVPGNHDIYWRGEGKPEGEHERDFETTFGPLWYAVQHKHCWFVVLYSDEGDPKTGRKDFGDRRCQQFSDAQFEWLRATLQQARDARHVFVFLHHPRWHTDRYPGSDWDRVHQLLVDNGHVTAVFAGHIHRMRFDGVRDGIQYFTLATVGANLDMDGPQVGFLHELHVVTVRPEGIQVAALPVGTVIDPKTITGEVSEDAERLNKSLAAENVRGLQFAVDGSVDGLLRVEFANPALRAIELTVVPSGDASWTFSPDHTHVVVPPGERSSIAFAARRGLQPGAPTLPELVLRTDYLVEGLRLSLPEKHQQVVVPPPPIAADPDAAPGALLLSGEDAACLSIDDALLHVADGALTVEAWIRGEDFHGSRAVVTKTEQSEYGLFASGGKLSFLVFAGSAYATATSKDVVLHEGQWHHLAGVFDGTEARAYLDGKLVAQVAAKGSRRKNHLPLQVGANPDRNGAPTALFAGLIDEVRISTAARYKVPEFEPARRFEPDADTALLLHLDEDTGSWTPDASPQRAHALRLGSARCQPLEQAR